MIVVNEEKDEILLIQQYGRPTYILVAGYVSRGEGLEDAVVREVKEETGLTVSHMKFNRTQFFEKSDTLMCNFTAFVENTEGFDPNYEIDSCKWFSREGARANIRPNSLAEFFLDAYMDESAPLAERFEFRDIRPEEAERAAEIEQIVFPPNEAVFPDDVKEQAAVAPDLFLVAVDRSTGEIAGFLNGIATNETEFRDEFFTDKSLHDPDGSNVMLLGLDVVPEYQRHGLGTEIMRQYCLREKARGRRRIVLTCLPRLVAMYTKMGFTDLGVSGSTWGGESWHEMEILL
jgi:8-oxo-dGTP pyrophosphatase MutT (NUDIX family)